MIERFLPMSIWWKIMYYKPIFIGMLDCPEGALLKRKTDMIKGLKYYLEKETDKHG